MTLGQRIQSHRTALNLSQEALGEKLGVTRQAVHKWEADGAVPDTDRLIALSKLFGITLNELLQVEGPKPTEAASEAEGTLEENRVPKKSPQPSRLLIFLCCASFLLGTASFAVTVGKQLGAANDRIAALEWEVSLLKGQLALNPAAPLIADFEFNLHSEGSNISIDANLIPHQLPKDLEISFSLSSPATAQSTTVPAIQDEGRHYTATLSMDGAITPLILTATLSGGSTEYAQPLVRILSYSPNTCSWETLWDK